MTADLYIPTYGRVGRQRTWSMLPDRWRERTALVCRPEEADALADLTGGFGVLPTDAKGISATRQWIVDQHRGDHLIMMDDDLRFAQRRVDDPKKFRALPPQDDAIGSLVDLLWSALEAGDAHVVGLASRGGAHTNTDPWRMNARLFDVMGMNVATMRYEGFRYRQPLMEDFDLQLQFLTRGYPTLMLNSYTKDDDASQADGGCSTYRDGLMQAEAAWSLEESWPDLVKVRYVRSKSSWDGMQHRADVTVQWAKAYEAGLLWRKKRGLHPIPVPDWYFEEDLI